MMQARAAACTRHSLCPSRMPLLEPGRHFPDLESHRPPEARRVLLHRPPDGGRTHRHTHRARAGGRGAARPAGGGHAPLMMGHMPLIAAAMLGWSSGAP